jgi:hypothetical protein
MKAALETDAADITVNSLALVPRHADQFLVCNRSNTLFLMDLKGTVGVFNSVLPLP